MGVNDQSQFLAIPVQTAQAILNYLSRRPYDEVVDLVQALQTLKALENDNG